MFPWKCQKSYIHEFSSTWLLKKDLNKNNTNRHAYMKEVFPRQRATDK